MSLFDAAKETNSTSPLYQVDTDALLKDPNLKFDPQNPSAHLSKDHPNYKDLLDGLSPEQREILQNVTEVDGLGVEEEEELEREDDTVHGTETFIDPETGEVIVFNDSDLTLDELGFIDPSNLRQIVMEAFHNPLNQTMAKLVSADAELNQMAHQLRNSGRISKQQAQTLDVVLGGHLSNKMHMESFTSIPTATNFKLTMEEVSQGQAALMAGGAIVGVALIYKLVKWMLNSWNNNAVASGSIKDNVGFIMGKGETVKQAGNIVEQAKNGIDKALADIQKDPNFKNNELTTFLKNNQNVSNDEAAIQVIQRLDAEKMKKALKPFYGNLWLSLSTGKPVNVGNGQFTANQAFFASIVEVIKTCKNLQDFILTKTSEMENAANNIAIQDGSPELKKYLDVFQKFGSLCGYSQPNANLRVYTTGLMNHVQTTLLTKFDDNYQIVHVPTASTIAVIDPEAWSEVNENFLKEVKEYGEKVKNLAGKDPSLKEKITTLNKAKGQADTVRTGDKTRTASRLNSFNTLSDAFQAEMNMMRTLVNFRNSIGKGLSACRKALEGK